MTWNTVHWSYSLLRPDLAPAKISGITSIIFNGSGLSPDNQANWEKKLFLLVTFMNKMAVLLKLNRCGKSSLKNSCMSWSAFASSPHLFQHNVVLLSKVTEPKHMKF